MDAVSRHDVASHGLILHSDNGSPMKGSTMLATLQQSGVMPSFSRPGVSNDIPFSESLFRTLKYRPEYPSRPFESDHHAQMWVDSFVHWHNTKHLHSEILFVTPDDRHYGKDKAILAKRKEIYEFARKRSPGRWTKQTGNWNQVTTVWLNPEKKWQHRDNQYSEAA